MSSDPIGLRGDRNTFGYVGARPLSLIDRTGLLTLLITTSINGIGTHSGIYIHPPGGEPSIYDPAGDYLPPPPEGLMSPEPRGSGDYFSGDEALLDAYIKNQRAGGSRDVELTRIPLTPEEEQQLVDAAKAQGGRRPGYCASGISDLLSGVCGIDGSMFPGELKRQVQDKCRD